MAALVAVVLSAPVSGILSMQTAAAQVPPECLVPGALVWRDVAYNKAEITNSTGVSCPLIYAVYNTFGNGDLSKGDQYLLVPDATGVIGPHTKLTLEVQPFDATCYHQVDVIVGWHEPRAINPLTYSRQYGTEFLVRHVNHPVDGPALTRGERVCQEHIKPSPTPTPTTPPAATSTAQPKPSVTATRPPAPLPPNTGQGVAQANDQNIMLIILGAAALTTSIGGLVVAVRRKIS